MWAGEVGRSQAGHSGPRSLRAGKGSSADPCVQADRPRPDGVPAGKGRAAGKPVRSCTARAGSHSAFAPTAAFPAPIRLRSSSRSDASESDPATCWAHGSRPRRPTAADSLFKNLRRPFGQIEQQQVPWRETHRNGQTAIFQAYGPRCGVRRAKPSLSRARLSVFLEFANRRTFSRRGTPLASCSRYSWGRRFASACHAVERAGRSPPAPSAVARRLPIRTWKTTRKGCLS